MMKALKSLNVFFCFFVLLLGISIRGQAVEWEWMNPLPQGNSLSGIWGTSENDIFAVGNSGMILHYDGTGWSEMPTDTGERLHDVWGTTSSDVHVVGSYGIILRGSR